MQRDSTATTECSDRRHHQATQGFLQVYTTKPHRCFYRRTPTKPHRCFYRRTLLSHTRVPSGAHHQATEVFLQAHTTKPHKCSYSCTPPSHTSVLQPHTTKPHTCFYRCTPPSHTRVFYRCTPPSHTSVFQAHTTKPHKYFYRHTPQSHTCVPTGCSYGRTAPGQMVRDKQTGQEVQRKKLSLPEDNQANDAKSYAEIDTDLFLPTPPVSQTDKSAHACDTYNC